MDGIQCDGIGGAVFLNKKKELVEQLIETSEKLLGCKVTKEQSLMSWSRCGIH